jgi:hypothetical protein
VLPFSQDLDADKIHVQAPTSVIFLCGGPISSVVEPIPLSLRDAFLKILENPVLKGRDLIQAEDITPQISFFNKYENILDFETDLAQIVELIILFCESEGSLAELGAFAMINEIALRLFWLYERSTGTSFHSLGLVRCAGSKKPTVEIASLSLMTRRLECGATPHMRSTSMH